MPLLATGPATGPVSYKQNGSTFYLFYPTVVVCLAFEVDVIARTPANGKPSLLFANVRYIRYGEKYRRTNAYRAKNLFREEHRGEVRWQNSKVKKHEKKHGKRYQHIYGE